MSGQAPAKTQSYDLSIANVTVDDSIGHVSPSDPTYSTLPRATNSPPKPIDPASTYLEPNALLPTHCFPSLKMVLHLLSAGVEGLELVYL